MDEALFRRLVGAAVLLAVAFGLASLLPQPRSAGTSGGTEQVVTYDLRTGQPATGDSTAPAAQPPKPSPPVVPKAPSAGPATTPLQASPPRPVLKVDESFENAPAGAWFVQIGSFESQANARGVVQKLSGDGLPALQQEVPAGSKRWYRVRVGPYPTQSDAQRALASARQKGFPQSKLVRPDAGGN